MAGWQQPRGSPEGLSGERPDQASERLEPSGIPGVKGKGGGGHGGGVDVPDAQLEAERIEAAVALRVARCRAECYAIPLRPGPTRGARRWAFLLVTDAPEEAAREALAGARTEFLDRRGDLLVLAGYPP